MRPQLHPACLALVIWLACNPLFSDEKVPLLIVKDAKQKQPKLRRLRTRFYDLHTDLPDKLARLVGNHMDRVHVEYQRRFRGFPVKQKLYQPLHFYRTKAGFYSYLQSMGIDGRGSAGMWFLNKRGTALCSFLGNNRIDDVMSTLRHEGFHQFGWLRLGDTLPMWADEGLGEYFGDAILVRNRLRAGRVDPERLARLQKLIKKGRSFSLRELLNMQTQRWNQHDAAGKGQLLYDQSWAVVHFLVQGSKRYQAAFVRYLQQLAQGKEAEAAYVAAFGTKDYSLFERHWKTFMLALKPDQVLIAKRRLEFLADGMLHLIKKRKPISSLSQMQKALKKLDFVLVQTIAPGVKMEWSSHNDFQFEAPGKGSIALIPSKDWRNPPGVLIKGLKHRVMLDWMRRTDGRLIANVHFK